MNTPDMTIVRRRFSNEQKIAIMSQAEKIGICAALRENTLSYSVYARWKQKMKLSDQSDQNTTADNKTRLEMKHLLEENTRLKKIITDLVIDLELKNEELIKIKGGFKKVAGGI